MLEGAFSQVNAHIGFCYLNINKPAHRIFVHITFSSGKNFKGACANGQTHQSLCSSHAQSMDVDEDSGQNFKI